MVTIRYLERGKEGSEGKETEEVKGRIAWQCKRQRPAPHQPGHKHTARPAASRNQTGQMARKSLREGKERPRSYSTAFITPIARVCYMARSQWRLLETLTFNRVSDDDITILRHRSASQTPLPPTPHTPAAKPTSRKSYIAGHLCPTPSEGLF